MKEEILKLLNDLKSQGHDRRMIEQKLRYSPRYIDQQVSKGGTEKLLNGLKHYKETMLQNATPPPEITQTQKDLYSMFMEAMRQLKKMDEKLDSMQSSLERNKEIALLNHSLHQTTLLKQSQAEAELIGCDPLALLDATRDLSKRIFAELKAAYSNH